jgi:hypothetical protein
LWVFGVFSWFSIVLLFQILFRFVLCFDFKICSNSYIVQIKLVQIQNLFEFNFFVQIQNCFNYFSFLKKNLNFFLKINKF